MFLPSGLRRWASEGRCPDAEADRLSLAGKKNETIYCSIPPAHIEGITDSHLDDDAPVEELTYKAREAELPADSPIVEKIRKLRKRSA